MLLVSKGLQASHSLANGWIILHPPAAAAKAEGPPATPCPDVPHCSSILNLSSINVNESNDNPTQSGRQLQPMKNSVATAATYISAFAVSALGLFIWAMRRPAEHRRGVKGTLPEKAAEAGASSDGDSSEVSLPEGGGLRRRRLPTGTNLLSSFVAEARHHLSPLATQHSPALSERLASLPRAHCGLAADGLDLVGLLGAELVHDAPHHGGGGGGSWLRNSEGATVGLHVREGGGWTRDSQGRLAWLTEDGRSGIAASSCADEPCIK